MELHTGFRNEAREKKLNATWEAGRNDGRWLLLSSPVF